MARRMVQYPFEHALALARVLRVIDIIAAHPSMTSEEVIAQLLSEGIEPVDAKLLVAFVPCALSCPILATWGLNKFPAHYAVPNKWGRLEFLPLSAEHYFTAALQWAQDLFGMEPTACPVSLETFWAVVSRSPMLDAAIQLRDRDGPDALRGAECVPLVINYITLEEIKASRREDNPERPWWQFWRRTE